MRVRALRAKRASNRQRSGLNIRDVGIISVYASHEPRTGDAHPCACAILAHRGPEKILVDESRAKECFDLLDREIDTAAISTPHVEQSAGIPLRETREVSSGCEGL